ncbi:AsmA-like C-terminal region-containing protein [Hymenobacter yonginensis]|uniref:AsmA-like C-terminal domain-containing protein n=1 Tax=Hymenobacter yonginensis TaxID=748197 RepID=A0ABY7PPV9_9BACT|nr:AsmA-like C-terminal region-containing protein [Hymenobacter yonginensis]WBO84218.1 hypothetical protein O9Z63_17830 [Hymenobacter yonginensis]
MLFFFLTGLVLLVAAVVGGVWLGQERIIALFVQEANRYLATPVQVGRMEVSVLDQFPRVSITLHELRVSGSLPQDTVPLARARRLYCAFDAWDMLRGHYRIRAVTLADGRVWVRHDAQGRPNYDVLRFDTTAAPSSQPLAFALENIQLERVNTVYADDQRQQRYTVQAHDVRAQLDVQGPLVDIVAQGRTHVDALQLGPDAYFQNKPLTLNTRLRVDRDARLVTLQPSELRVGAASYELGGRIDYRRAVQLDLQVAGRNTDVQSVLALLPARVARRLRAYRSRGAVYFGGTVRGELSGRASPRIEARFGCRDASFYHPELRQAVEHVFLAGTFSNGAAQAARTSVLSLREVRGTLRGRPFSGSLRYANFQDPTVQLQVRADLDVAQALQFYPVAAVPGGQGQAQLLLAFAGNLRQFRARPATAAVQASGTLQLQNVQLRLRDLRQPLTGLTGSFRLQGREVEVAGFTGRVGGSDFRLQGRLRNALAWALLPNQTLLLDADLTSQLLDFDQLLRLTTPAGPAAATSTGAPGAGSYEFRLPTQLALNVRAQVERLRFRRFRGRQLRGTIRLQQQVLSAPSLTVRAGGGQVSFRGTLDARQPRLLHLHSTISCQQLPLDSLFYTFEDFGQQFITARHLRGALTATAESDLYFDGALTPLTNRLEAELNLQVRNGELNNFEPLQKLSMIAGRERLRHLRFAQLTTPVYIQSRTVYLPEMEIRSNVRAASLIRVTGTHTFDQQMDYHLSIPILPGLLQRTVGMATGPSLLLAIQGDEDNFRVSYDRRPQPGRVPTAPRETARPASRPGLPGTSLPGPAAPAAPAPEPRKPFELKKPPAKKPAQPQTGEYFEF